MTTAFWCSAVHAQPADIIELEPGRRVEKKISAGESHLYATTPIANRPRRLIVEQRGIDLVVVLQDSDDSPPTELNNPLGRFDREVFELPADVLRLELRPLEGGVASGHYAVMIELLDKAPAFDPLGSEPEEIETSETGPASVEALRRRAVARLTRAAELPLRGSNQVMEQAAMLYETAAASFAELDDRRQEARALLSAANFRRVIGDAEPAHELYRQAHSRWVELNKPGFVADSLAGLGQTARHLGRSDQARAFMTQALRLFKELDRGPERAGVLTSLGLLAQTQGDLSAALTHYREALEEQRRAHQRLEIAILLLNIGSVHARLGNAAPALENERQALELFRELGDRHRERSALNNLAVLHRRMGEPENALSLYSQALRLAIDLGDRRAEARGFSNRGVTYFVLGDLNRAAGDFERALALRRDASDLAGQVLTLANLGDVEYHRGNLEASRQSFEAALELARRSRHRHEVTILGHLGRLLARLGEPATKLRFEEAHRLLAERDDPEAEAALHYRQGEGLLFAGDIPGSRAVLEKALARSREVGDEVRQIMSLTALGNAARTEGRLPTARDHLSEAIALIESLRTAIDNPDLRASFLSSRHDAYALLIDVLMEWHALEPDAGHDRSALELSERSRARRLLDLLAEAEIDLDDAVTPELVRRRRRLLRRLSLQTRRRQLAAFGRQKLMPGEDLNAAISDTRADLDLVEGEIRRNDPRRAALAPHVPLTTDAMQRLLDDETLLLHYSLGELRSYLWAVTSKTVNSFELAPRYQIETLARRLHQAWSTLGPTSREDEVGLDFELATNILGPAVDQLQGRRIAVVADGALHYVPFAALPIPTVDHGPGTGERPVGASRLVERFEVVRLPSAAVLATRRLHQESEPRVTVAVIADPIFGLSDSRLSHLSMPASDSIRAAPDPEIDRRAPPRLEVSHTRAPSRAGTQPMLGPDGGFGRLPGTRREAEAIAALVAPDQRFLALSFDASYDALSGGLAAFSIVHFATHAVVDTEHPELSGLVLSQFDATGRRRTDGILRLHDIYRLDLEADLVVLSGCRTSLGRELRGEGLQGLTGGFLYAGARRVAASLWSVGDQATAELMRRFYRAHLSDGLPPAAALRRAQLDLATERRFRDPYYWAPFVLHGDWR